MSAPALSHITDSDAYVMPAFPTGISADLQSIVDRYIAGFAGTDDDDAEKWDAAAHAAAAYSATTTADIASKFLLFIHYECPGLIEGELAILDMFDTEASRLMALSIAGDLVRAAEAVA
jgi:hypothetical protein